MVSSAIHMSHFKQLFSTLSNDIHFLLERFYELDVTFIRVVRVILDCGLVAFTTSSLSFCAHASRFKFNNKRRFFELTYST